jgi:hypothetical protein
MLLFRPCLWILRISLVAILGLTCFVAIAQDSAYQPGPNRYPKFDGKQSELGVTYGQVPGLRIVLK